MRLLGPAIAAALVSLSAPAPSVAEQSGQIDQLSEACAGLDPEFSESNLAQKGLTFAINECVKYKFTKEEIFPYSCHGIYDSNGISFIQNQYSENSAAVHIGGFKSHKRCLQLVADGDYTREGEQLARYDVNPDEYNYEDLKALKELQRSMMLVRREMAPHSQYGVSIEGLPSDCPRGMSMTTLGGQNVGCMTPQQYSNYKAQIRQQNHQRRMQGLQNLGNQMRQLSQPAQQQNPVLCRGSAVSVYGVTSGSATCF